MRAGRIEQEGTPAELYAAPRTRFAAGFLGVRNILEAELDGGLARLADGTVLQVTPGPPGAVAVAFRPGAVVLGAEGAPATISRVLFAGEVVLVYLQSGPVEICAHARPSACLAPGKTVRWQVVPSDCRVLRE